MKLYGKTRINVSMASYQTNSCKVFLVSPFTNILPEIYLHCNITDENPNNGLQLLWSTIEPMDLVERAYPTLVNDYQQLIAKPKKATRKKRERKEAGNSDSERPTAKSKPTRKKTTAIKSKNPLIDRFLQKNKLNGIPPTSPKIKTCSTPVAVSPVGIDLDASAWSDDDTASDSVINGILTKSPEILEIHGRKLRFDRVDIPQRFKTSFEDFVAFAKQPLQISLANTPLECLNSIVDNASTPISSVKHRPRTEKVSLIAESEANISVSHFFGGNDAGDEDAFEASINFHNMPDEFSCDSDCEDAIVDSTESDEAEIFEDEDKLPIRRGLCIKRPHAISRIMSDTFDLDNYVPIGDKLRQKLNSN